MNKKKWLKRCTARYESKAGLSRKRAREFANAVWDSGNTLNDYDSPEQAADEDMSCWKDNI